MSLHVYSKGKGFQQLRFLDTTAACIKHLTHLLTLSNSPQLLTYTASVSTLFNTDW